ncbi:SDR family NAD(P)-dependent oxidoreductase [Oculatella sp. LEGE 06141]|uniref:SDR family NAD(P)-dependent oxidoreductase n=1 Tax=Oculatella sp. LEGE 06141 TaxID=1828648 RepID=UPI0018829896|nr:SDR family NAD(P)-dependent oxidoreductase [Oculatella sp. LEGE 06141]MBE9179926.1 SDR family NAD(P)-dependent oxidoreductase [Oculatella sp. LEGE 06141]
MTIVPDVHHANVLVVGASQGIGLEFVQQLLQADSVTTVYATYRTAASAVRLLELGDRYPGQLHCLELDITNETQIANCATYLQTQAGQLHLIMNCVGLLHDGTLQPEKSIRQIDPDQLIRYFQINSIGAALLAKHLLPLLRHGDRSIFATLSAKLGSIGDNQLGGWYGYRASKAALNMLMRTVAIEFERKSPKTIVVTLHPGTTDTRLSQPFQMNVPPEKLFSVERTVTQLLAVMADLKDGDSGQFFSWNGDRLPW